MTEKVKVISKGLKALFLIHGIFSLILGAVLVFVPYTWAELTKYGSIDPNPMRLIGAFTLALVVKDWLGFIAKEWSEVRIIVILEVIYTLFGGLASLYVLIFVAASSAVLTNVIIFALFFCAWTWLYMKHK